MIHGNQFEPNSVLCYKDDVSIDDAPDTVCAYASPSITCDTDDSKLYVQMIL